MGTKYAAARNLAFQWRSEYRKVARENRSLRRVYEEARDLVAKLPRDETTSRLRDALRNAVFAVTPTSGTAGGTDAPADAEPKKDNQP